MRLLDILYLSLERCNFKKVKGILFRVTSGFEKNWTKYTFLD